MDSTDAALFGRSAGGTSGGRGTARGPKRSFGQSCSPEIPGTHALELPSTDVRNGRGLPVATAPQRSRRTVVSGLLTLPSLTWTWSKQALTTSPGKTPGPLRLVAGAVGSRNLSISRP